jgi:hypothetical protein
MLTPAQGTLVQTMLNEAGLLQDRVLTQQGLEFAAAEGLAKTANLAAVLEKHAGEVHPVRSQLLRDVTTLADRANRETRAGVEEIGTTDWAVKAARVALAAHVLAKDMDGEDATAVFKLARAELEQMQDALPNRALGTRRL